MRDLWPEVAASRCGVESKGKFPAVELLWGTRRGAGGTAASLLCSGLAASIDEAKDQTSVMLVAAETSFREPLRDSVASAALFDAGAAVDSVRPMTLLALRTASAAVWIRAVACPVRELTVDRRFEVESGLQEEMALLRAELCTPALRLGGYAILMAVLAVWPVVGSFLGAPVDPVRWVPWELGWTLLVDVVAWRVGGVIPVVRWPHRWGRLAVESGSVVGARGGLAGAPGLPLLTRRPRRSPVCGRAERQEQDIC